MYHRVTTLPDCAYPIVVSPENFAKHMDVIRRHYRPLRLLDLVDALEHRSIPDRGVVITFDDGYIDNFAQALPILEECCIPATIFVTAGIVDIGREFWWDELARNVLNPDILPKENEIPFQGQSYHLSTGSWEERNRALSALHLLLKPMGFEEREIFLNDLAVWAGRTRVGRPGYRSMNSVELHELSQHELIDIGAHTVTHPQLSALSLKEQILEIAGSRERLELITGKPVESFAYPYGTREDFDSNSVSISRSNGFRAVCSTVPGKVTLDTKLLEIPRFPTDDWDAETFEHELLKYFYT